MIFFIKKLHIRFTSSAGANEVDAAQEVERFDHQLLLSTSQIAPNGQAGTLHGTLPNQFHSDLNHASLKEHTGYHASCL